jgi:hypothetical protein
VAAELGAPAATAWLALVKDSEDDEEDDEEDEEEEEDV